MACSWPCCATCCSFLSAFGIFFLLILGALMQQKSHTIELDIATMENHYLAPYVCAGVYFAFFVVSCVYLYIHSRRKPTPQPGLFALGPMAEAGGIGRGAASTDAPGAHAVEMEEDVPRRSGTNAALETGNSMSRPETENKREQVQASGELQY